MNCPALHTPPPRVVRLGRDAVLAFLRDLGAGSAPCHLVKLVLLGEKRAGKSSLADSLVYGRPATRPADDRTVGIDVRRWWLGAGQGDGDVQGMRMGMCEECGKTAMGAVDLTVDMFYCNTCWAAFELGDSEAAEEDRKDEEEQGGQQLVVNIYDAAGLGAGQGKLEEVKDNEDEEEEGGQQLVALIYDAAGHRVYRATHGAFMTTDALFLHVVRSDESADAAAVAMLEWVEAVQQEAPGAVMGVVWTHADLLEDAGERDRLQRAVLARVQAEIERQVRAVDEAMLQAESAFDEDAAWRDKQALRNAELEPPDRVLAAWQETGGHSADSESIGKAMDALTRLATLHHEMQVIEERMVSQGGEHAGHEARERLQRLREQRLRRPRILFRFGVSSKTGHGLAELRRALAALMKDQRLFPHVGMKVPLSYAMLERLAQEGRLQASQETQEDGKDITVEFMWSNFCEKMQSWPKLEAVWCQPEEADAELTNADQLVGKLAVVRRNRKQGKCSFAEKAQRAESAGALGLVIVNTKNELFVATGGEEYVARIPVVMIRADDAEGLLNFGDSSCLRDKTPRAAWEDIVTSHSDATASAGLRTLCEQPFVSLRDLEREAAAVGIDKELLHRALQFLHATGSVLHYGSGARQHSKKMLEVVFMQPQFIINVISYVIREAEAKDVNDKLRALDARIRGTPLQRDLEGLLERGEVTRSLLNELWNHLPSRDRELMLEVMKDDGSGHIPGKGLRRD
jgi:GTPase SAR1 family protein